MYIDGKADEWLYFSDDVTQHIEEYAIPQYGDKKDDECGDYKIEDLIRQIKKYAARHGKNSRPGQDQLDLIKIAHTAQMAYTLNSENDDAK